MPDDEKTSRLDSIRSAGGEPDLPEITAGQYLLGWLTSIGMARTGISGAVPVDFTEIMAWQVLTGHALTHWEAETLHALSVHYANTLNASRQKSAQAPYVREHSGSDDDSVARFLSVIRRTAK